MPPQACETARGHFAGVRQILWSWRNYANPAIRLARYTGAGSRVKHGFVVPSNNAGAKQGARAGAALLSFWRAIRCKDFWRLIYGAN
jgi:hypothetical protein